MEYINNDASIITLVGAKSAKLLQDISCVDVFKANIGPIAFCNKMGKIIANGFYKLTKDTAIIRVNSCVKDNLSKIFKMYAPLYGIQVSDAGHPMCSFSALDNYLFKVGDYYEALPKSTNLQAIPSNQVASYFISENYFEIDADSTEQYIPNYVMPEIVSYTKGCFVGQEILARLKYKTTIISMVKPLITKTAIQIPQDVKILKQIDYDNQYYYLLFAKNPKSLDFTS